MSNKPGWMRRLEWELTDEGRTKRVHKERRRLHRIAVAQGMKNPPAPGLKKLPV